VSAAVGERNLILLGAAGAGKGTQAQKLAARFGIPQISTGDMLRAARREGTPLGRKAEEYMNAGKLVPDEVVIGLVEERLQQPDAKGGFILDGFPRTIEQAKALDKQLSELGRRVTAALLIDVPDEEVVKRLSGRRVCVKSGHNYHVDYDPPKHEDVCDQDGSRLIRRDDDDPDVIKNRLRVYHDQTAPLIDYFDEKGVMRRIDGTRDAAEVHDHIRAVIATLRLEDNF
jgi:adenylate kinase